MAAAAAAAAAARRALAARTVRWLSRNLTHARSFTCSMR